MSGNCGLVEWETGTYHRNEIRRRSHIELVQDEVHLAEFIGGNKKYMGVLPILSRNKKLATMTLTSRRLIISDYIGLNGAFWVHYIPLGDIDTVEAATDLKSIVIKGSRGSITYILETKVALAVTKAIDVAKIQYLN